MNYAIIDVETTGSSPANGKITEIAIYIYNGSEITDSFCTLVNPECGIPWTITKLTGITNEMVEKAPKFYEIAKKIVEITANTTFVAHNASFDYSFVREEFKRLGYDYKRKTMCTVSLSRKLIPGLRSYSLGNICNDLNITIEDRHRASGDALATVKLFEMILRQNETADHDLFTTRKGNLSEETIASLPGSCGVYYLYDAKGDLIYIGKSRNIHQRIVAHLNNRLTKKAMEMSERICSVSHEETGSELIALLQESDEIKSNRPFYNRSQRRSASGFGIFSFEDENGYLHLQVKKTEEETVPLTTFNFYQEGVDLLHVRAEKYDLCKKLCHLDDQLSPCFNSRLGNCRGACEGKEDPETYNLRVLEAIKPWQFHSMNFFILEKGKNREETAVVKISRGKYFGYGFICGDCLNLDMDSLHDCIHKRKDNWDARNIIRGYLKKNHRLVRIIEY
ncbi:MAG TPA: exonuclease domain-containing protein [Prolixibacteraceae bacterium]|nr:exonuclease domain-containing protein [Prolixibacteraceae bacterium]